MEEIQITPTPTPLPIEIIRPFIPEDKEKE
jgi:hypothetical protein